MPEAANGALALTLVPEVQARRLLTAEGHGLTFRLLRPPYAALGVGALRVLRVRETAGTAEIVAGYERYERLERSAR